MDSSSLFLCSELLKRLIAGAQEFQLVNLTRQEAEGRRKLLTLRFFGQIDFSFLCTTVSLDKELKRDVRQNMFLCMCF